MYIFVLERDVLYSQWKMGIKRSLGWDLLPETDGKQWILAIIIVINDFW